MQEGTLDIKRYWRLFVKWWWLFALCVGAAAAATYFQTASMPPLYRSSVKIVVESHQLPGVPNAGDIRNSVTLAQTYSTFIETGPVLREVDSRLGNSYGTGRLAGMIDVVTFQNVIEIGATARDPAEAAAIADVTARAFISNQLDRQVSQLRQFQDALEQYGINQSADLVASQAAMLNVLNILDPATQPSRPLDNHMARNIVVATAGGLFIAALIVLLVERMQNTFGSVKELKAATGFQVVGLIPRYARGIRQRRVPLASDDDQMQPVAESCRYLQANLELTSMGVVDYKTLLITSAAMKEGKTTTAINFATWLARTGKSVILVDGDFQAPSLHRIFGLGVRQNGLAQALTGTVVTSEIIAPTVMNNLRVVSAGFGDAPLNMPFRIPDVARVVERLKDYADLVIFDSAPLLSGPESAMLASLVDGVVLVIDSTNTNREMVAEAAAILRRANPPIVGIAINKLKGKDQGGYYLNYHRAQSSSRERSSIL